MARADAPEIQAATPTTRERISTIFGPLIVGLVGGGAISGAALLSLVVLLRNCADTYGHFPSLPPPSLATDLSALDRLLVPLAVIGTVLPFLMGLATYWLVRPRDVWGDISAGITTALASTLSSFAAGIGWGVILALTVVPSIADLTWFGNATRQPAATQGPLAHPSAVLVEHYPDLADSPPDERGGHFMAKIVSDQVIGSAWGVWLGLLLSLASVGCLGFCSTLAAGYLGRRGGSLRAVALPYLELTVSTSLLLGLSLREVVLGGGGSLESTTFRVCGLLCLAFLTAMVVLGVLRRWRWVVRLTVAVAWTVAFLQALGNGVPWYLAGIVYLCCGTLIVKDWLGRQPRASLVGRVWKRALPSAGS